MIQKKNIVYLALLAALVFSGCTAYDTQLKDIPIEERDQLLEEYIGRKAWTRTLVIDIGADNGIIDRDIEVEIVSLDIHWNGAVGVRGPNNKVVRHTLDLPRPLTRESFEERLSRVFWFRKPDYRYRMNLREFGKRTAKAIYNHELFKGMPKEAALQSWGYPDQLKTNDIGGSVTEQWIYVDPRQRNKKRYIFVADGDIDRWEE
ncbi:MAG: hypothetical protein KAV42_11160 [Candidatus Krumholzibacteria bacterium]|nr:hypothetical protein [Candidatus Krumholzibacteria bacterium]